RDNTSPKRIHDRTRDRNTEGSVTMNDTVLPLWKRLAGPYLALLFRVGLGVVFIAAALPKIADPLGFANAIANYHLVPTGAINLIAITLPWIEIVVGAALVLGLSSRANLLTVFALLVIFIVAISITMSRGLDITCGCFSVATNKAASMTRTTLIWDIVWTVMCLHALIFDRGLLSLSARLRQHPTQEQTS
ncbi:MAG: DoxX family membrane protein, partial [Deltaproteobacteria bacterium]|nr:DoxX family membrane protein [Deltaproteobacteria bacterium]